jgi:hypothetical protein
LSSSLCSMQRCCLIVFPGIAKAKVPGYRWKGGLDSRPHLSFMFLRSGAVQHMPWTWGRGASLMQRLRKRYTQYDVARSAYILCTPPHYKVSYSAHVTFNEQDFPLRGQYKPDSQPFELCEERASVPIQYAASGEVWGGQDHSRRNDRGVLGTLGHRLDPGGVTSLQRNEGPLPRPEDEGGPVPRTQFSDDLPLAGLQRNEPLPVVEGGPVRRPQFSNVQVQDHPGPTATARNSARDPLSSRDLVLPEEGVSRYPRVEVNEWGAGASSNPNAGIPRSGERTLRRSSRTWKPSGACLENIAHATRELGQAEREIDTADGQWSSTPRCQRRRSKCGAMASGGRFKAVRRQAVWNGCRRWSDRQPGSTFWFGGRGRLD